MLVCELMEACIFVGTCGKSSIRRSSHLIPSTTRSAWSAPITGVPLQRSVQGRVLGRGEGSASEARLGITMRGVVTTTLMVTRVATPIPSVPLGLAVLSWPTVIPPCEFTSECEVVL
jgi:hypothetical protein